MAPHHQIILTAVLLGAARAAPPGGGGGGGGGSSGASCAADGSSASYTETITTKSGVDVRKIVSTGCPNHESYCTGKPGNSCGDEGKQTTLVEGKEQSLSVEVPANPKLKSSYTAGELDCSMGTIAYALNVLSQRQQLKPANESRRFRSHRGWASFREQWHTMRVATARSST